MAEKPKILVVGSINMDRGVRSPRLPQPGETVLGGEVVTHPGGKGANQAVAASRLGGEVTLIARVGDDAFGTELVDRLRAEKIRCDDIMTTFDAATGVAMIIVDQHGENSIVVASGANFHLTPDDLFPLEELFADAQVVLLQMELPLTTVSAAIKLAKRNRCKVILDPAPAPKCMPDELCEVDVISPNVSEAEILTGKKAHEERVEKHVAMDLIARGAKAAVMKLGSRGCVVVTADEQIATLPAFRKPVVDTTGAGDAFTAALAVGIGQGRELTDAARFANAAGAIACTRLGAQQAMPTVDEVRVLLADNPPR